MTSSTALHDDASFCHNCGAATSYHYCAVCGQETELHPPSAAEFIHEFVGHYIALEGRLWKTLAALFFRPGFLTAEYIAGRRIRYVQPLRVYLTFSILFFAALKLAGPPVAMMDQRDPKAVASVPAAGPGKRAGVIDRAALQAKADAFVAKPPAEQNKLLTNAFFSYVPYALFLLMPLFALYLKLLYLGTGRRYGEHLLFALHANAFAFAMIAALILAGHLPWALPGTLLVLWLAFYLPVAMRRVYGGGLWGTGLRWVVLMALHMLSIGASFIAAYGAAVLF